VGVQNFYPLESGAFTGENSIAQIKDAGATAALIGHSERRMLFGEDEHLLKEKVNAALKHEIKIVFCCGEPLEIREAGSELNYVKKQLKDSLFHLTADELKKCVIAYEPVWAIGTGRTASTQQAEDMHAAIRSWIAEIYGLDTANDISILYGGSCNASNAKELFACPNVDGGLIGGASLKTETFMTIVNSF
jgi:triosephosphate isomerase